MAQTWQAGDGLPLWTPLSLSGMPLAANQLAMLFYPPAWLFLWLPPEPVFNGLFIFHLTLGGAGMVFLLRRGHGLPTGPALLGGLAFALNGKWLAHIAGGHASLAAALAWLPWALVGLLVTLRQREKNPAWPALAALALAMQLLTHTLAAIYTVYLLAGAAIWHSVTHHPNQPAPARPVAHSLIRSFAYSLIRLFAILVLAGLLAAVQLWPLVELAGFSNRSLSLTDAAAYALSPLQLVMGLVLPSTGAGHELIIYLGLTPLLLAPLGLTRRRSWPWFYAGVILLTVLFSLGPVTPLHSLAYHLAPGFRWVRTPARIFFVTALAVAALTGFGAHRLTSVLWPARRLAWLTRLAVALGAFALLLGAGLAFGFGQFNRATLTLALVAPLTLAVITLRARQIIPAPAALAVLGLLLWADLASFGASLMRFVPAAEALAPGQPAAAYLAQKPGLFRVYSPSYSLPAQTAAAANLSLADGVEPVHLAVYDRFMARAGGYSDEGFSVTIPNFGNGPLKTALQDAQPNLRLLGLLNVDYLAAAFPINAPGFTLETSVDGVFIYRNPQARPRAWLARQAIPIEPDWLTQLANLPDLADTVLVEDFAGSGGQCPPPAPGELPPVQITRYTANTIEARASIAAPGWLVFSEMWYPGWEAEVNDQPQPVARVNGLLRGVCLPESGQAQVTLTYRSRSVRWGGWLSAGTAVLLLGRLGLYGARAASRSEATLRNGSSASSRV